MMRVRVERGGRLWRPLMNTRTARRVFEGVIREVVSREELDEFGDI